MVIRPSEVLLEFQRTIFLAETHDSTTTTVVMMKEELLQTQIVHVIIETLHILLWKILGKIIKNVFKKYSPFNQIGF